MMFQKVLATAMTVVQVMKIAVTITKLYVKISRKPDNFDCPRTKLPKVIFSVVSVSQSLTVNGMPPPSPASNIK